MENCLFCNKDFLFKKDNVIHQSEKWIAILDGFPITEGHTLIIPLRHVSSFFELTEEEYLELYSFMKEVKELLYKKYNTTVFNIGINDGEDSGQTIFHLHIHLIPRRKNDGGLPCGIRNIFPLKANYKKI